METLGPEGMGTVYEIIGPGGPHQYICDGKTKCVVDLIKRSLTTPGSVCRKPELGGPKSKSNSAMEYMNEELLDKKEEALVKLLQDLETEKTGMVWSTDVGEGRINSGPGKYGVNKSGVDFLPLLC